MKRRKMTRSASKRVFRGNTGYHRKNLQRSPMRGGIRL